MDSSNPLRSQQYNGLPTYDDLDDGDFTPTRQHPAGVRLLTSHANEDPPAQSYVKIPVSPNAPSDLSLESRRESRLPRPRWPTIKLRGLRKPVSTVQAHEPSVLPVIPEGVVPEKQPSRMFKSRASHEPVAASEAAARIASDQPASGTGSSREISQEQTESHGSAAPGIIKVDVKHNPNISMTRAPPQRSSYQPSTYQPSLDSFRSQQRSLFMDAPVLSPSDPYGHYASLRLDTDDPRPWSQSQLQGDGPAGQSDLSADPLHSWSPTHLSQEYLPNASEMQYEASDLSAGTSPTRTWSPSRLSHEYTRPPPGAVHYEPADLDGHPRPGSPSSKYGGSPKRPLPPAPLFTPAGVTLPVGGSRTRMVDDATVAIPLDADHIDHDEDDPFTQPSDLGERLHKRDSYGSRVSQDTLNEDRRHRDGEAPDGSFFDNYGMVPDGKQERRGVRALQMTRKEVQLINGELVLECKIPTILYSFLPRRDEVEFTHMRYTAVTCDPDDFVDKGYKLRQNIGKTARETELFICITMYNENEIDFTRTMHAVMKNVSHFCGRNKSRTWGENGWQKIVVCIVSDGREKIHPRTLDALAAMGVYQHGIAKNYVNSKAVQAHVYEYTTQVSLDADLKFKGAEKGIVPCQMIFCLKEKNAKKLNSHRWCFNAFGKALNPNVCILLDVGTRPGTNSLYHLWKAFDSDSNVAGACGEIKAMKGKWGINLLNPLVASQNFEYKMSNILDKPLESVFGYITVLPGALSAYRYHALQNDETGHGPLSQYFKGETLHGQHADVFTANMYLAEDRILCWELVAKRNSSWVLRYVKGCTGETDVPDSVPEFISQRRRWLNGAFFAAVYSLVHFKQIWATDHSFARKVLLHIEFLYQFLQLFFTYFSLANFYLTFYFVAGGLAEKEADPFGHGIGRFIFTALRYICVLLICVQFILSLGNRPQGAKKLYLGSMILYSIIMMYTMFATVYTIARQFSNRDKNKDDPAMAIEFGNNVFTNLIVSTASTLGLYFFMSFMYLDPWHMFTSAAQYFVLLPSYICTLQVYAFCNTHDVTWGTKGDNVMKTDLGGAIGKGSTVELEMPSEQLDIDSGYDEALRNLRDRVEVSSSSVSESQLQEDYYKSVRTYMVTSWMIANAILAMAMSEVYGSSGIGDNAYLRFILWSVAALALFRALGSTTFAIISVIEMVVDGRVRLSLKIPTWLGGFAGKITDSVSSVGSSVGSGLSKVKRRR